MFIEGQDSIKKELAKRFPTKDFVQIDNIFHEEEEEDKQEEVHIKGNLTDGVSTENIDIDENVTEAREEETEDISPPI